jgi:hypothetical protein
LNFRLPCIKALKNKNTLLSQSAYAWLGVSFWNITIAKENEAEVKEVRKLIDEDGKEEQVC